MKIGSIDGEGQAMMVTFSAGAIQGAAAEQALDDEEAGERDALWIPPVDAALGGVAAVQVKEGEGRFLLTASLSNEEAAQLSVDLTAGALGIRSARIVRWVPVPLDALVNEAVVHISERLLVVSIPLKEGRTVRHVLHVW